MATKLLQRGKAIHGQRTMNNMIPIYEEGGSTPIAFAISIDKAEMILQGFNFPAKTTVREY